MRGGRTPVNPEAAIRSASALARVQMGDSALAFAFFLDTPLTPWPSLLASVSGSRFAFVRLRDRSFSCSRRCSDFGFAEPLSDCLRGTLAFVSPMRVPEPDCASLSGARASSAVRLRGGRASGGGSSRPWLDSDRSCCGEGDGEVRGVRGGEVSGAWLSSRQASAFSRARRKLSSRQKPSATPMGSPRSPAYGENSEPDRVVRNTSLRPGAARCVYNSGCQSG